MIEFFSTSGTIYIIVLNEILIFFLHDLMHLMDYFLPNILTFYIYAFSVIYNVTDERICRTHMHAYIYTYSYIYIVTHRHIDRNRSNRFFFVRLYKSICNNIFISVCVCVCVRVCVDNHSYMNIKPFNIPCIAHFPSPTL